ncbi:MAG: cation transporter [Flavobacteriia bacterium]|nr:cation transporter [Flavobacteriia bacterium]
MLVNGICGMCERTIEKACDMDGVESAEWSSETKELQLTYDASEVSLEDINTAINEAGYDTEYSTASEEVYNSIHNCCKYRDPEVVQSHEERTGGNDQ